MRWAAGLILLCFLTFVVGLGQAAITDSDEAYYAEAGREMVTTGDWTTPHYNFVPRLQKPILFYWLIAATYTVAGVSEWAARVWSGLAGVALALVAAAVAWRWCGRQIGLLAGAIVATSFGVVPFARQALPDMPLAFFVSAAIWAAIEAFSLSDTRADRRHSSRELRPHTWLYVSAVATALGMLTKGPVAVALPVTVLVPLIWWEWRRGAAGARRLPVPFRHISGAVGLFILVAAPWYLAVMQVQGIDYARQFFIGENVERFATSTYNEWRGWQYVPVIIAGLLPWSAFLVLWTRPVADWLARRRQLEPQEMRLLCWAGGPLTFFTVSVGSQPRYILPCLVPIAILLARSIWSRASKPAATGRRDSFFVATMLAGGVMVLVGALLWRATLTLSAAGGPSVSVGPAVMLAIGFLTMVSLIVLPRRAVPVAITVAAALSLVVFHSSVLSPERPEPAEVMADAIRAAGPASGLCACGAFARSMVFYVHRATEIADVKTDDVSQLRTVLDNPDRVLAMVDARALTTLETDLGKRFPRLAELTYLNTGVWQRGEILLRPDPNWVQRVILIANR